MVERQANTTLLFAGISDTVQGLAFDAMTLGAILAEYDRALFDLPAGEGFNATVIDARDRGGFGVLGEA